MKKIFTLILVTMIAISSKAQSYTFTYGLQVDTAATFFIVYNDANGHPVQGFFTGTNWSQSITTTQSTGFKWAYLVITQPGANVCPACRPEKGIEYISLSGGSIVMDSLYNPFPLNNRKNTQPLYRPAVPLTYPLFK